MEPKRDENLAGDPAAAGGENAPPHAATLLTTEQAAQVAHVDPATIRRWKKKRLLTPLALEGARGDHFTLEDVRTIVERRTTTRTTIAIELPAGADDDGDLAAELFAAFDACENPVDIVKRRKLSVRIVDRLYSQWERLRGRRDVRSGRVTIPGELAAKIFHCFEMGWTLSQLVVHFQVTPEVVRKLWREYETPLRSRSCP